MERHSVNGKLSASQQNRHVSAQTNIPQSASSNDFEIDHDLQRIMRAATAGQMPPRHLLQLQRAIGNAATRRLIAPSHTRHAPTVQRLTDHDVMMMQKPDREKYNAALLKAETHNTEHGGYQINIGTIKKEAKNAGEFAKGVNTAIFNAKKKMEAAAQEKPSVITSNDDLVPYMKEKPEADVKEKKSPAKAKETKPKNQGQDGSHLLGFGTYQAQTPQNVPVQTPRNHINATHENIRTIKETHPGQVTRFAQSNMTADTISFEVTVEVPRQLAIDAYHFVIHLHPAGGVNPLHAKTTHQAATNIELSFQNWLVAGPASATTFQASRQTWNNQYANV